MVIYLFAAVCYHFELFNKRFVIHNTIGSREFQCIDIVQQGQVYYFRITVRVIRLPLSSKGLYNYGCCLVRIVSPNANHFSKIFIFYGACKGYVPSL